MFDTWHNTPTGEKWSEIKNFWMRRFFRIVPTLWLWVGLSLLGSLYFNASGAFGPIGPVLHDAAAAILNYANIHVFLCVIGQSQCGPNPVYWSLSLEEQFYFLLPLLFFLPRKAILILVTLLILIQLPIHRMPWEQTVGGALWFIRTDAILLGVLIAWFSTKPAHNILCNWLISHKKWSSYFVAISIIMLSATPRSGFYFAAGGIALISGVLVLIASFNKNLIRGHHIASQALLWIGSRSFSLYLLHMPIYYFVTEMAYRISGFDEKYSSYIAYKPQLGFAIIILLAIVTEANYRWIETPFRNIGKRFSKNSPAPIPNIN